MSRNTVFHVIKIYYFIVEWVPIFVACPGNKRSVYRAWVTPSPINNPLIISPGSCIRDHQRRSIIDHWNWREYLIDQVIKDDAK